MAVEVTVLRRRRDKDFYSSTINPSYSYAAAPPPPAPDVGRVEKSRLSGLASRSISINFVAFASLPIVSHLKVYKYVEVVAGNWQQQEVLYKYANATPLTVSSLTFEIDASESLTGVIVEYVIQ